MQTGQVPAGAACPRLCGERRRILDAMKNPPGWRRVWCGRETLWRARRKLCRI